jgi:predicted transcriptional regulator
MNSTVPSVADVRQRLSTLKDGDLDRIAKASGVPSSTLWKIRIGDTTNPGLETVRKFFHLLPATPAANDAHTAQAAEQGVANA